MRRIAGGIFALVTAAAVPADAQVPAGAEFRVNTLTTDAQTDAAVAADGGGNFVVAWSGFRQDPVVADVMAQRFAASGAPQGAEFRVPTSTLGAIDPAVARTPDGRFVVVWDGDFIGISLGIYGQRFDAAGRPQGAEFRADTYTLTTRRAPAVSMAADGRFVVVWESGAQDGSLNGVFAQRFDASGARVGGEFRVNTYTTGAQTAAAVTMTPGGGFVAVWESDRGLDDHDGGIFAQRFDASGTPAGAEFRVNTYTTLPQWSPSIASDRDGNFLVVWASWHEGNRNDVFGQLFASSGEPRGGEFRVNTYTALSEVPRAGSAIGMDARGNFTVTWSSGDESGDRGIFGQRFDFNGQRRGEEYQVNDSTTSFARQPAVASDPSGNLLFAWNASDGDASGITARRYGGLFPASLAIEDGANRVAEVGDSFSIVTAWRNYTGAPQDLSGVATGTTAPPGLQLNVSPVAIYGTVPHGAIGSCGSFTCFGGILTGTRPSGHVDVSVGEFLLPDAQGQEKRWVLHVGDSFNDVPRTSPFYRFVETMLHRGISAGCGAGAFCPASETPREQVAVLGLLGKEGAGYLPPACGVPRFLDVPASSPFCRWIEELARREVVIGCGGGNFCPSAPVTREQLCVIILRLLDPTLNPPPCTTPMFGDVPASSPFCRWVEEMARRGVVTGCGGGNFCPTLPVTREQVSVFVTVAFGLTLYGP